MITALLPLLLLWPQTGQASRQGDARALVDTIEALQQGVDDFRCEFEGTLRFKGAIAAKQKLGDDGLSDQFSGIFIWKKGGDTRIDGLSRLAPEFNVWRRVLVVRASENKAEQYDRLTDKPVGYAFIQDAKLVNSWNTSSLGQIFLIDKIKREMDDSTFDFTVSDDQLDGRPLKVLSVSVPMNSKVNPGWVVVRYWIDLRRNGHVVRHETYTPEKVMSSRWEIKLAPFKVRGAEVWMPVSGEMVSYGTLENGKPAVATEPTALETIYVVNGTMEFNKNPPPAAFTIKYKPGTPISDRGRKLEYEFGRQQIGMNPTKAEARDMLADQIAQAERQIKKLVAVPPSQAFDWSSLTLWGTGAVALTSLVALAVQRRRQ